MKSFTEPLGRLEEFDKLKEKLTKEKGVMQVSGCIDTQKPHFIYSYVSRAESAGTLRCVSLLR